MTSVKAMPGWDHFTNPRFIRVSALLEFCRCPRRYFYHYGCGLQSREPRLAMKFGEAIHAAIGRLQISLDDFPGAIEAFNIVWKDEHEAAQDNKRNRYNAVRILTAFQSSHRRGCIYEPVRPPQGLIGSSLTPLPHQSDMEIPFTLDLGLPIMLVGRIDGLGKHRSTGKLWTVEYKTTSECTPRFFEGFEFNPQVFSYAIACRAWNLPVEGCFVEGLEVKAPLKTKESELKVQIQPVFFQDFLLEEHLDFIRWKISEVIDCIGRKSFTKDFTGCNPYSKFGMPGYNCDYRLLCNTPDWQQNASLFDRGTDHIFHIPTVEGKELPDASKPDLSTSVS